MRTDLIFLRRRSRPVAAQAPAPKVSLVHAGRPTRTAPARSPERRPAAFVPPVLPPHIALPPLLEGIPSVSAGERRVLGTDDPVVQLNRVQAGIGALRFEVASGHALRLAVAYVWDGRPGIVQGPGAAHGPDAMHPVVSIVGETGASIDLGNSALLDRFVLLLQAHQYGGTLVVTTAGEARLAVPLPEGPAVGTLALVSGYRVRGALVIRSEVDQIAGGLREATRAYGYDEIGWLDTNTPLWTQSSAVEVRPDRRKRPGARRTSPT